ncbi:toxin [Candidatus Acetothermia bacterium]|nr:toxin [Candidatus Acetothermia bacterium]
MKTKEAASEKGQASAPALSLPKGGGAIRGIGEKFAANPVTGTGSMSVPIFTSPGRSGFGPQLSLSYDSGVGNGPFGFGWSLSLPSITRKTDKGLPRYDDFNESDVFILSGAEDLVPEFEKDAVGNWVIENGKHTVYDKAITVNGVVYKVRRYRPRIEGLFARIERWTRKSDGDVHWRSISKDNITTLYGKTAESRISDPADPTRIFSWLICESYDDKGNSIIYEYVSEDSTGIDLSQANEQNRTEAIRSANRYLKRIKYGNKESRLVQPDLSKMNWVFEIVFDYEEEHYESLPLDAQGRQLVHARINKTQNWPVRQDPFSSYRSGFEVRTYRLCQRVLMFHHIPDELSTEDYLVRSTEFAYDQSPIASFITEVTQSGYVRQSDGTYLQKSLPPLEFEYSQPTINEEIREIDKESLENLPSGLDGTNYQWADLDGEGVSGILTEQADAWFYKPNLGEGRFGPLERVASKPSLATLSGGRQQLLDLAGDGQLDLVEFSGPTPGFFERTQDQNWDLFRPFAHLPNINWSDPNLRFVDLNGDGHADVLITEQEAFTWYPSLAEDGFASAEHVRKPLDEEKGPQLVFVDGTQSIYLADMSGDGLTDLVRIRNGEVCYWPNLGYGKFGTKISMDNAPWFDSSDQFDQKRVRLADIDGSGNNDIIYLSRKGVRLCFNQSGNRWSEVRRLASFPAVDNLTSVTAVDLLGNGTACLVWSSPLPGNTRRPMRYIDLMGGMKPHLLISVKNNLGAETHVHYASSTHFYLTDKAAGQPWITRLPFPVHAVERVETYDRISRNRFVTRYAYHHGYFDGIEREFRGFGMVEQWDTEEFAALSASDAFPTGDNIDATSHVPPVLTRTWFHTGAFFNADNISRHYEDEYYREGDRSLGTAGLTEAQEQAMLLQDTILPTGLTPDEALEACRSLKGSILRQEIYALDGTEEADRPYSVSERNYTIQLLQPREANRHAVFFTHARETVDFHYERNLFDINGKLRADPRVTHAMTLDVDDYGNVLLSAAIGYGRRRDDPDLTLADREKQKKTLITFTVNRYTNPILEDDNYRVPSASEVLTYELIKLTPSSNLQEVTNLSRFDELRSVIDQMSDGTHDLPYEDVDHTGAIANKPYRRLIEQVRTLYRGNDLAALLHMGQLQSMALPGESYKLALTPGLIGQVYGGRITDAMMENEGVYVHSQGDANWWIPSGQIFYSPKGSDTFPQELAYAQQHFFLPCRFRDPFEQTTIVTYDSYNLLIQETRDPLSNRVTAGERNSSGNLTKPGNDYRVLQPKLVMDPNRNRSAVAFDALGKVVGTAVMGKPTENLGDSLDGFESDLDVQTVIQHLTDPLTDPHAILLKATTRLVYDLFAYVRTQNDLQPQPIVVYTLARETHDSDLTPGQKTKIQHNFSYSDGFGREIQKKIQAEPGPLVENGADVTPRWVGSGWTIFNNKGKPVRQYEPFFSPTHRFEFAKVVGVSPVLFYDPVERVVATLHPNHTYEKVVFDPWQQATWDVNDTALQADPKNDSDVGDFFHRIPEADYIPTWHESRKNGQLGAEEQAAATKTSVHADTPTVAYFDTLGRTFLTIAYNRFQRNGNIIEEKYATRTELDIEGNQRAVIDAKDRIVMRYDYDILGNHIHQASMEAGERWMLNDVAGKPIRTWNSRGFARRITYDELRRPTDLFVNENNAPEILAVNAEKTVYGELQPNPETKNLRGKVFQAFDGAGGVTSEAYDFKGNLLRSRRQLAVDYKNTLNWSTSLVLEQETFASSTRYDALNRPIQIVAPHSSLAGRKLNIIQPAYNEANWLEKIHVWLQATSEPTGLLDTNTATFQPVMNIDYNAKGQRTLIENGNGVKTSYIYDEKTFRLIHLLTRRKPEDFPQDCPTDPNPPCGVQNLHYVYDPVGNITSIRDDAQQTIYFKNAVVEPHAEYTYDAIYRLVEAAGREHIGQLSQPETTWDDKFRVKLPHPQDGQAMRRYTEQYEYDFVGNFEKLIHQATNGTWTRAYTYNEPSLIESTKKSNRLSSTAIGTTTETYSHDSHGNMITMPHLSQMSWDFKDQFQAVDLGGGGKAYYLYDANGQRVRKVHEHNGSTVEERIYLSTFEIYQKRNGTGLTLERETLHIMDDKQRVALVETRTQGNEPGVPAQLIRYQFGNHLGSARLELDDQAQIISYEEYTPYGSTSYQAVRSQTETAKRYRYTGKERDEESGLYYYGARYYAAWLGRWTSCDPIGIRDGLNIFVLARNSPISLKDVGGLWSSVGSPSAPIIEIRLSPGGEGVAVEAVHEKAIQQTLTDQVPTRSLNILMKQQKEIDKLQAPEDQPLHAMTGEGMTKKDAIDKANRFVQDEIKEARRLTADAEGLQSKIDSLKTKIEKLGLSQSGEREKRRLQGSVDLLTNQEQYLRDKAMEHLGNAIHTLQDATSPAHEAFQTYHPDPISAAGHAMKEFQYPNSGTRERARLEAATRWGFEMYKSGDIPQKIFDESGRILIPRELIKYSRPESLIDVLRPKPAQYEEALRSLGPGRLPERDPLRDPSPMFGLMMRINF